MFNKASCESSRALSIYIKWNHKLRHPFYDITLNIIQLCNVDIIQLCNVACKGPTREFVFCKTCHIDKSHKLSFVSSHERDSKAFDLVYLDLCTSPKLSYKNKKILIINY